jgi:lysozyme
MDSAQLQADLRRDEGWRHKPYLDTATPPRLTIGCGRNLSDKGLSDDEVQYLLENDINECVRDLATFAWWETLSPIRQRVIANLRFNLGPAGFRKFQRMIAALNAGDYDRAAASMKASRWYTQTKRRAVRLVEMMISDRDPGLG